MRAGDPHIDVARRLRLEALPPIDDPVFLRIDRSDGCGRMFADEQGTFPPCRIVKGRKELRDRRERSRDRKPNGAAQRHDAPDGLRMAMRKIARENAAEALTQKIYGAAVGFGNP